MNEQQTKSPFDLLLDQIREVVREEIRTATGKDSQSPTLLSAERAAKLFDVPKTWISDAARRGELPSVKLGHYVRFRIDDLHAFVATRSQKNS
ncbi:MAG: DNA-binding protein [Deltaproteobacteria bacterium]|nr:DNA-binding protein [Deltaproteobacteria bacterium]